jgi:uncharacterized membrane protein (UPF0127 family)
VAWLLRDGEVLASLEVARTARERRRGLLGRDTIDGALLLQPARAVHTIGMRFTIDVAFCDRDMVVVRTTTMRPYRMSLPVVRSHAIVEAEAGAFARWELRTGDRLEVKSQ